MKRIERPRWRWPARRLAIPFVVVAVALVVPGVAAAQDYPAPPVDVVVSEGTPAPGEPFVFEVSNGFIAGEEVVIRSAPSVDCPPGQVCTGRDVVQESTYADANGGISATIALSSPGAYTITATGVDSALTVTQAVSVVEPAGSGAGPGGGTGPGGSALTGDGAGTGDGLPVTGRSGRTLALSIAGALALVAGGLLLWLTADRRRRRAGV